jgi:hypothetical protein
MEQSMSDYQSWPPPEKRPVYRLDRLRAKLEEGLSATERDYLRQLDDRELGRWFGVVGDIDRMREVVRHETEARAEMDREEQEDRARLRHLGLTPLQERLFRALEAEEESGLSEADTIEIVYRVEWHKLREGEQALHKTRLRTLQHALNDKLLLAKSPLHVVRPEDNWLVMQGEEQQEIIEVEPKAVRPRGQDVEECMARIREYLADGPRETEALTRYFEAKGYRPGTIRRARTRLGVRATRSGYGAGGKWLVCLPAKSGPS